MAYCTALRDNVGHLPEHTFALGVSIIVRGAKYNFKILLPEYFLTEYPSLNRGKLAQFISFYGSGGTTTTDHNKRLIVNPGSLREATSGASRSDGDSVMDVVPTTPGRLTPHHRINTLSHALRSTSPETYASKLKNQIEGEVLRTSATPFQLDHNAEAFIPTYASTNLKNNERLRSTGGISEEVADLFEGLAHQICNNINYMYC